MFGLLLLLLLLLLVDVQLTELVAVVGGATVETVPDPLTALCDSSSGTRSGLDLCCSDD